MNGNVTFDGESLGAPLYFEGLCHPLKLEIPNSMKNTIQLKEQAIKLMPIHMPIIMIGNIATYTYSYSLYVHSYVCKCIKKYMYWIQIKQDFEGSNL